MQASGESIDHILEDSKRAAAANDDAALTSVDSGTEAAVTAPARRTGVAGFLLGGIKTMGRAVMVTGRVMDLVNAEAATVLERYRIEACRPS